MFKRLRNRFKFEIERFILYRSLHQLLLIAVVIAMIAILGGLAVWTLTDDFASIPDAVWWSFLRLTDPGYIGDDEGTAKRTISTVVSVLGYIFFLGALVAVMTQGLNQLVARLQRGLTPIAQNNHILILGWTNRTPIIVKQLILSEGRVRSFLTRQGASALKVVILAEEVTPELTHDLRTFLGPLWSGRQVTLRSGTPLRLEHLERVDFLNAAVIILPAGEFGEDVLEYPDGRAVKALLSMKNSVATHEDSDEIEMPLMVAEISDHHKTEIARSAYGGPIETLESNTFISQLMAQIVRNPGLSHIYQELLTHEEGNEIYLRRYPELVGQTMREVFHRFPGSLVLGLYREDDRRFYPLTSALEEVLTSDDRLVMIAAGSQANNLLKSKKEPPTNLLPDSVPPVGTTASNGTTRRVLLLGWNRSTPTLLHALNRFPAGEFEVTSLALITDSERNQRLSRQGVETGNLSMTYQQGEFTSAPEVLATEPWRFDNIVIFASEWMETSGESDARTILGYLVLEKILAGREGSPKILAQLMNEANVPLFPEDRCETLTSPVVLSHLLAQIALQRKLRGVFDELFGPGGAELYFRSASEYEVAGREDVSFEEIQVEAFRRGEIAIGLRLSGQIAQNGGIVLNPERSRRWNLCDGDDIVVIQDLADA